MAEATEEFPSVKGDFEQTGKGEAMVAGIQPLNVLSGNNVSDHDTALLIKSLDNAIMELNGSSESAAKIPALATVSALNSANNDEEKLIQEELDRYLFELTRDAGDASDVVSDDVAVGLELPQKVESPNIKDLMNVDEIDMMEDFGLMRQDEERIETASEARAEVAKILAKMWDISKINK